MATNGDNRLSSGQFAPGHPGGPGRPLGTPNRARFLRDRLEEAIEAAGGQTWINRIVRENPVEAIKLLARLQPRPMIEQATEARPLQMIIYPEDPRMHPHAKPIDGHVLESPDE